MNDTMMMLLCDTYKICHDRQYPKGMTKLVSYWTPRKAMSTVYDKMVFFGLQAFIIKYLEEGFNTNFFKLPLSRVMDEFHHYMNIQIGEQAYDDEKIAALHKLGYLPLQIRALPEGSYVNMGIPCIELTNTHSDFAWLVQWVECLLQSELWAPCAYATIGHLYKESANNWYSRNSDKDSAMAMADFGMRGMSCMEDSIRCGASWLLSFNKTSTIPAIKYLENYYDLENPLVGIGAVSTEHSVMSANAAIDGNEVDFVKRMLTELYPNTSFSMVSDTYDYWNMVENIIPSCKEEILAHNGKLLIRPDSGDMVDIVCGKNIADVDSIIFNSFTSHYDWVNFFVSINYPIQRKNYVHISDSNKYYIVRLDPDNFTVSYEEISYSPELVGTIRHLWNIFGGDINSKGYKVLNPHIGIIYGDGCSLNNVEKIYSKLDAMGFAADNIVFGVGAFCFHALIEPKDRMIVLTRDTWGIAMKATYGEFNGKPIPIYKDPKTDTSHLKKSHKGCCSVEYDKEAKEFICSDGYTEWCACAFKIVFYNGRIFKENFETIRNRLENV